MWIIVLFIGCSWSVDVGAVLIASGDGTENATSGGFFGWDYVGEVNGLSGTYLGDGWVLTANHVGPGDFLLDGVVHQWVPGTEVQLWTNSSNLADLVMFSVWPPPALPPLVIRTVPPQISEFLVMVGCGRDRGSVTSWDPNGPLPAPPDVLDGWNWAGSVTKRWGTNEVTSLTTGLIRGTVSFYTAFDDGQIFPEAQATAGDSGGAVYSVEASGTELAGIIYAVGPSPGQPASTALFTNLTFIARLDFYIDEIEETIALPEPTGALGWGIGLLLLLGRAQRRARR